jgi:hypothetical protein
VLPSWNYRNDPKNFIKNWRLELDRRFAEDFFTMKDYSCNVMPITRYYSPKNVILLVTLKGQ